MLTIYYHLIIYIAIHIEEKNTKIFLLQFFLYNDILLLEKGVILMKKENLKTYSVRLDTNQRDELEKIAVKEQRTVSNLIRVILSEFIENYEQKK